MHFKTLLPFERFTLTTDLSSHEVSTILRDKTDISIFMYAAPFHVRRYRVMRELEFGGQIHPEHFTIWRLLRFKNIFRPIIKGKFDTLADQTIIRISMAPHYLIKWFSLAYILVLLLKVYVDLSNGRSPYYAGILLLVGLIGGLYYYHTESVASRYRLQVLLKAQITREN